jgi:hypothetical protein
MRIIAPENGQYVSQYMRLVLCSSCAKPEPSVHQPPRIQWRLVHAVEDCDIYHICLLVRRTSCCLQNMKGYPQKACLLDVIYSHGDLIKRWKMTADASI